MTASTLSSPLRHLRDRDEAGSQRTTTVELFFDLVYVFAITQLSHLILGDLSVGGVASAAFLLLIVWWAWIYTTWMVNWFDPASPVVRAVLAGVMLASLLMAAALPEAFGDHGVLFAASYVVLQVGRNLAAASLLPRDHPLRRVFERLVVWSFASRREPVSLEADRNEEPQTPRRRGASPPPRAARPLHQRAAPPRTRRRAARRARGLGVAPESAGRS